jgi:hypothetical protein
VDTGRDLERLDASLRTSTGPTPRHTRRVLDRWRGLSGRAPRRARSRVSPAGTGRSSAARRRDA